MSISAKQYQREQKREYSFYNQLGNLRPLDRTTLDWLRKHGKDCKPETLIQFGIQRSSLRRYDRRLGPGERGLVFNEPCIVIPAGPVLRCYCQRLPKKDRWFVVPGGQGAQWIGDTTASEVIICEGEWDCLRLNDLGFTNAITHTAGAGTWLPKWTNLFRNKRVWICYDRDGPGQIGAEKVAKNIFPVSKNVRIVDLPLPGTADANDVSDFFRLGYSREDFQTILKNARQYVGRVHRTRR